MSSEWKPGFPPHESPSTQDDELGRIVRVFVLGLLIAGVAGVISAAALGPPRFNEPTVRAPGGAVSARAITAGLIAIAIGLPTGGLLSALLLGELGRGLAIGGFGAITAIRAASPEAAGILDKIIPKIEIWDGNIGPISGEASLRYRDRNLLPDVDITAISARTVGAVDLRATATGTISVNGDEHVTGILGVGARTGTTRGWVDLSGSVSTESRAGVLLSAGLDHPEDRLIVRGDLGVTTGPGFNGGRVDSTVTLEKKIRMDGGRVTGSFGLFGGAGVDLDGKNEDVRGGLMLRLRW